MARIAKKPSSRRLSALEVFTDREDYIDAFDDLLACKNLDENDVLVYYGEGGIGKTTLSRKLQEGLVGKQPRHISARLDFGRQGNTEPDVAMFRLREQLPFAFPTFSIALADYAGRVHPEVAFLSNKAAFLENAGPFTDLLEVALDTPGFSVPLKTIRALTTGKRVLGEWYAKRAEPLLRGLSSMSDEELLALLPELWSRDFRDGMARQSDPSAFFDDDTSDSTAPCPVVFLDTYEALWRPGLTREGGLQHVREGWLVDLIGGTPEIMWVVTGRDRLTWDDAYDASWQPCCHQHLVGGLSPEDSASFLAKRGITDPAIVDAIVKSACGLPFYLEAETQLWDVACATGSDPAIFGGTHAEVIERLLSYLDDSQADTMYLMSAFGSWDAQLFEDAVTRFSTGYPARAAERFGRSWSIEQPEPGVWSMHQELVSHLQAHQADGRPEMYAAVHRWGFERFDERLRGKAVRDVTMADVDALFCARRHALITCDSQEYPRWFWERLQVLMDAAVWRPLTGVVEEHLQFAEATLGPEDPGVGDALDYTAGLLSALGQYEQAEMPCRRSLEIKTATYGPDHPEVALALGNLAVLLRTLGRYGEAEALYRRSLEIRLAAYGPDHPEVAVTLGNLAVLLKTLGRYGEAEALYRRSLELKVNAYGSDHPKVGIALVNLAMFLGARERNEEAEPLYRSGLAILEAALGPDHPKVAVVLDGLARLRETAGRPDEAEPLYRRSLEISEATLGPNHPEVATTLHNLGGLLEITGRREEAEVLYRRSLAIKEGALGSRHPSMAITLSSLAGLLADCGRAEEAEGLHRRSLEIATMTLGANHPEVAIKLNNLAGLLGTLARYEEAESLYRRSLTISQGVYGVDHADVRIVRSNLEALLALKMNTKRVQSATAEDLGSA